MTEIEKVIKGLEACALKQAFVDCKNCPYNGGDTCIGPLMRDALDLLKEQEARVLTPKEVEKQAFNPVWLEVKSIRLLQPALFRYARPEYMKFAFSLKDNLAIERDASEYGFSWRCWTYRPSPEKMRDTPWELPKEEEDAEVH